LACPQRDSAAKPHPKRLLFNAEYAEYAEYAERFFIFYYKDFLLCDLCALCGEKILCLEMARFHDKVTLFLLFFFVFSFSSKKISIFIKIDISKPSIVTIFLKKISIIINVEQKSEYYTILKSCDF